MGKKDILYEQTSIYRLFGRQIFTFESKNLYTNGDII
jgi:hypothetical protein